MESWCLELVSDCKVTVIPTLSESVCLLLSVCAPSPQKSASLLASFDGYPPICVARLKPGAHHAINLPLSSKVVLQAKGASLCLFGARTAGVSFIRPTEPVGILKTPCVSGKKHGRSVSFSTKIERSLGDGLIYEVLSRGRPMAITTSPGLARWRFRLGSQEVAARLGFQSDLCEGLDLALRGMCCGEVRKIQVPSGLDSLNTPAGEYTVEFLGPVSSGKAPRR